MYLSYSGFKQYISCGFSYWCGYIGKIQSPALDNRVGSLYGSIVGTLFEELYKDRLWLNPQPQAALMDRVEPVTENILRQETSPRKGRPGGVVLWKGEGSGQDPKAMYESKEELLADVRDTVPRGLRIIRHHRLLGPRAEAETKLDVVMKNEDVWAGRSDFIIQRAKPHDDLVIVDGKGSRHRDRYVDPQQLQWYAMLYWLKFDAVPDKLAFLFWRFEPDQALDWIDTSEADLVEMAKLVKETFEDIKSLEKRLLPNAPPKQALEIFKPKPNEANCRFCEFGTKDICPKGLAVKDNIAAKQAAALAKKKGKS
jgi:hypothetical protein